ncbi:hypothetical protein BAL199_15838 [alpha proteobacterium BAL199]|nr:hypothetical protein BAL199_15838 [alpha proteobacterium BAL199]
MTGNRRPRVLVVNAYVDPWRSAAPTRLFIPRAVAPYYLAGRFCPDRTEIRVHDEVHHGALLDPRLFEWPDLVVLTGLTLSFDRARQLSAYFRNARPGIPIAIGGPIARALPRLCETVFDYVCLGDVESLDELIDAALGEGYRADDPAPRFDMIGWSYGLGYIETTRNCNFSCAFCSLTGENRAYQQYSSGEISRQFKALGRVTMLMVLDNNFTETTARISSVVSICSARIGAAATSGGGGLWSRAISSRTRTIWHSSRQTAARPCSPVLNHSTRWC